MRRSAVGLAGALWAADALCQVSGSVSLLSDYRYRGVSLTGNRPAIQASVVYDDASGAYAGGFASNVRFASGASLQAVGFAGYATRFGRVDADVGVSGSHFTRPGYLDYGELHAGLAFEGLATRVSWAPTYFGDDKGSVYLELDASHALAGPFHVFAHAGVLHRHRDGYRYASADTIADASAGIGATFDATSVRLEWVHTSTLDYVYPVAGDKRRSTVVLSIKQSF